METNSWSICPREYIFKWNIVSIDIELKVIRKFSPKWKKEKWANGGNLLAHVT